MTFEKAIKERVIFFDGAMGSLLQARGLPAGEPPSSWSIANPDAVMQVHKEYIEAGADVITTNTFSAALRADGEEMSKAAVENAKAAIAMANPGRDVYVAFDLGPTGRLLQPMGDLAFDDCLDAYRKIAKAGAQSGADLFIAETMSDLREMKAAVLAANEAGLPVVATITLEENGRTLTGASARCAVALLEGLGVDALGMNCGFGPETALQFLPEFLENSSTPVIVQPNAGIPVVIEGKTLYKCSPEEFALMMRRICESGSLLLGGCCGTTPEFIKALNTACKDLNPPRPRKKDAVIASSATASVLYEHGKTMVGEGVCAKNPQAAKAYREKDFEALIDEAMDDGSEMLAIDFSGFDEEEEMLPRIVESIQEFVKSPLLIRTENPKAADAALRLANGRPVLDLTGAANCEAEPLLVEIGLKYGALILRGNSFIRRIH
ncbi:MAG: homocysteine S-methyltransferase family protein [Clostridiales bacterium]|jgi:5-methyltetrahydrofolate--homocysteine methyltransferase|nr:homocysteine S-methyltransferase family protein [Clostridiales bacterium]